MINDEWCLCLHECTHQKLLVSTQGGVLPWIQIIFLHEPYTGCTITAQAMLGVPRRKNGYIGDLEIVDDHRSGKVFALANGT